MNKLLFTFLFFVTTLSYATDTKYIKVTFQVKAYSETKNFLVCIEDECAHGSASAYVRPGSQVRFYVDNSRAPIKDHSISTDVVYNEIIWDKRSCLSGSNSVCHKKSSNAYSDTLCRTTGAGGLKIVAEATVKGSTLILDGCYSIGY